MCCLCLLTTIVPVCRAVGEMATRTARTHVSMLADLVAVPEADCAGLGLDGVRRHCGFTLASSDASPFPAIEVCLPLSVAGYFLLYRFDPLVHPPPPSLSLLPCRHPAFSRDAPCSSRSTCWACSCVRCTSAPSTARTVPSIIAVLSRGGATEKESRMTCCRTEVLIPSPHTHPHTHRFFF